MKYSVTSSTYIGEVFFDFDEREILCGLEIKANLSEKQLRHFITHLPYNIVELQSTIGVSKLVTVTAVDEKITFEMFWNRYNDKDRSSRKRCLQKWLKMSKGEQAKAYHYIPKYFRTKGNAEKKYCETYLNAEMWNNHN